MTGTPSLRTTSAVLPSCRRTAPQARTEPIASPSGRACEVSTNRWFSSTVLRTSWSIRKPRSFDRVSPRWRKRAGPTLTQDDATFLCLSLLHPPEQLIDARFVLSGTIVVEQKFRDTAQA